MAQQLSENRSRGTWTAAAVLAAVVVIAVATNALVALIAHGLGANSDFAPLTPAVYGGFTALGVLVGWLGWRMVTRRAARPRAVLTVLVPVATVVSLAPDLALLALRFIPGTNAAGVVALMVMHLVVVAYAVPGYVLAGRSLRRPAPSVQAPTVAAA
ncbi:hypothetical protein GCM10009836_65540 [Pseudonocardia ailaonensis]|uniref:Uncharacterized protein n=1 Tax=Pseudonocardia ailaonensis TaxID=367279 RepID=A0ABN2NM57_9PSEU